MTITYGSLFTGVGGFDLGFDRAGYECSWQVEWDPHCQQVLSHRWPTVPKYGDIQTVSGHDLTPVDVITYGSPCQDLSLAGKRAGLEGGRSSMFFEATRLIKEMRDATNGTFPRITIWENVAGALSSNRGDDFRAVLEALDDVGALGSWWYILDAQFFGVPQRRRRVFVVSVFDPSIFERARYGEILSVGQGRRRNTAKSKQEKQDAANAFGDGFEEVGRHETDTVAALCARDYKGVGGQYVDEGKVIVEEEDSHSSVLDHDPGVVGPLTASGMSRARGTESIESNHVLVFTAQRVGEAPRIYDDVTPALLSRMGTGGNNTPMIVEPAIPIQDGRGLEKGQNGLGIGEPGDPMYTLDTTGAQAVASVEPTLVFQPGPMVRLGGRIWEEIAPTLRAEAHGGDAQPYIAREEPLVVDGWNQSVDDTGVHRTLRSQWDAGDCIVFASNMSAPNYTEDGIAPCLTVGSSVGIPSPPAVLIPTLTASNNPSRSPQAQEVTQQIAAVHEASSVVRRLTPLECERLMGWDDFHTLYRADGKTNSDANRYKMCGNGVASPVAEWIASELRPYLAD